MVVNLKFRMDLQQSTYEEADGSRSVVLKDRVSEKYFRLSPYEYEFLKEFDGRTTIEEAVERFKNSGRYVGIEDARAIAAKAGTYGLLLGTKFGTAEALRTNKEKMKQAKKASYFSSVYFLFIPVLNPDRFLEKTLWIFNLLFNKVTFTVAAMAVPGAIFLLITGIPRMRTEYLFFFNLRNLMFLWITIALTKLVHEFSHAYTAKRFGLHVPQMGLAFLIFFPCLYCNTTDAWQLADRNQRMAISAAGVLAEACLAVFAIYVWYFSQPGIVNSVAFYLVAVSLISTLFFNGNPLIKFDGYFILIDLLRVPNLSAKSFGHLKHLFLNRVLGIARVTDTAGNTRESLIFPLYGFAAFAYRIVLYTGIVMTVYYRFDKTLGILLALLAMVLFVVRPVVRGAKTVYNQRGEIHIRLGGLVVFLLMLGVAFAVLLVPISRQSVYPCYLVSAKVQKLSVPLKTMVEKVFIEEGSVVKAGTLLYTLKTNDLDLALAKEKGARELVLKELELMLLSDDTRAQVPSKELEVMQADYEIRKTRVDLDMAKGGIIAPFNGVVTVLDYKMQEGYQPGEGGIVGQLESLDDCRVCALIPEQDLHKVSAGLEVVMWFPIGEGKRFTGKIDEIRPYSERDLKDSPFSSRLGGELATEDAGKDIKDAPLEPQYIVSIKFPNDKQAIPLGITGKFRGPVTAPQSVVELYQSAFQDLSSRVVIIEKGADLQGSPAHTDQQASESPGQQQDIAQLVARAQALALAVQFATRAREARTLDDLYLLLTNDVRTLIEFDRAFLMVHLGNAPGCVAASGQATLETKSKFHQALADLAKGIARLDRLLVLARQDIQKLSDTGLEEDIVSSVESYVAFSDCDLFLCVPLMHNESPVGHLVFEFLGNSAPDSSKMVALRNMGPFLAGALVERWILDRNPGLARTILPGDRRPKWLRRLPIYGPIALVVLVGFWYLFFMVPFEYTVGGEAVVAPGKRHVAFCKMEGLIDKVLISEGSMVKKDQVLATLDRRELEFRIFTAKRELDVLRNEVALLNDSSGSDPTKLAQMGLTEIKARNKAEEVRFLESRREYLEIKAPLAGVILTKDVETLAGKKLAAGEAFCEIAVPSEFRVDTHVPEDRILYVKPGQKAAIYFNSDPARGYELKVKAIAPKSEALPRIGNVYRVEAPFPVAPAGTVVGMKGIGKISVADMSIWKILMQRLLTRWNQLTLYF